MTDTPKTTAAAHIAFAIVDELIATLIARGVISEDDARSIWSAAASRLETSADWDANKAAGFVRSRVAPEQ